jgi:hypothetical protein
MPFAAPVTNAIRPSCVLIELFIVFDFIHISHNDAFDNAKLQPVRD